MPSGSGDLTARKVNDATTDWQIQSVHCSTTFLCQLHPESTDGIKPPSSWFNVRQSDREIQRAEDRKRKISVSEVKISVIINAFLKV